jgi:DnaJ-class molecular chaperone
MAEPKEDQEQDLGPLPCSPCRGTGKLNSNSGGEPHSVDCPWCEGSGVLIPEHDAQAAQRPEGEQLDEKPQPAVD